MNFKCPCCNKIKPRKEFTQTSLTTEGYSCNNCYDGY